MMMKGLRARPAGAERAALLGGTALWVLLGLQSAEAATFSVSNNNDSGPGSLRQAIADANAAGAGSHAINFSISNQTITLAGDLPALQNNITINGGTGNTLSGNNQYRGLFVYSGNVRIENLTIANATAEGGKGGNGTSNGGGGGAGLGGALFVNAGATVAVTNVALQNNQAIGGAGGNGGASGQSGGGGGLGGNGGNANEWGGGGGIGRGASGGGGGVAGAAGIVGGAQGGGAGDGPGATPGGIDGGGGGQGSRGGGGGVGGQDGSAGGRGGFGGGGGGGLGGGDGSVGGFGGGGGGGGGSSNGIGGFGGGGGGGDNHAGGFGAGKGGDADGQFGGGGGGGGMGGAIFVVEGGNLTVEGNFTVNGGSVAGGAGGSGGTGGAAGQAFGSGLFLQGNGTLAFAPGAGITQTISDVIADQTGSGGSGSYATGGPNCTVGAGCAGYSGAGSWSLEKTGTGTLVLNGNNTFTGGVTINGGTVSVGHNNALGTGTFTVLGSTLDIQDGVTISNATDLRTDLDINVGAGATGTHAGDISSTGIFGISKIGTGTLVLSGSNTYRGGTEILGGTLRAGAANTFSANSHHFVGNDTTLDLNGYDQTIGALSGSGQVTLGNGTLTLAGTPTLILDPVFLGDISGAGGLTKQGSYTQNLAGTNTYSGATRVNAGTLRTFAANALSANSAHVIASGATLDLHIYDQTIGSLAGTGQVTLGTATLTAGGDNSSTEFSGTMTGTGGFTKQGTGTQTLSGANTYSGYTWVGDGTLQAGAANTFSANSIHDLSNGAALDLNGYDQIIAALSGNTGSQVTLGNGTLTLTGRTAGGTIYNGNISGAGGLTIQGSYTQYLAGSNTYSGTTRVNAGRLAAYAANTFSANSAHVVASGATLYLRDYNQTIGSLAGAGQVTLGTATLTAGGDNSSTEFSGTMTGTGGFTKQGTGTQIFSGTNTYSGATNVNGGTLLVNGSIASSSLTTVNSGATVGGDGIVGNTVIASGGTLAAGNSIGQLDINGNLTFQTGATYLVEVDPTNADRTDASGTATLAGTVNAQFAPGSYVTRQYTILSAQGGFGGTTFGGLATGNIPAGFQASLDYQGNEVWLQLLGQLGMGAGNLSINQQNVATSLNSYFNSGGTLPPAFVTLFGLTGDALRGALNQASGESGASISQSTFVAWNQFFNMMFDPFAGGRSGMNGPSMSGPGALPFAADTQHNDATRLPYAAVTPKGDLKSGIVTKAPLAPHVYEPRWSIWGGGYGGTAKTDGNATIGSHDTTSRAYGFVAGADHRLTPDTLIGFALAGGGTSFGLAQGLGGGSSDLFQASVYARQNWGAAYLMGAFGYGWQDFTLNRTVTIAGNDKLEAGFNANTFAGRAEGGWRFGTAWTGMTPYAAVQVASIRLPGYSENATSGSNAFALAYSGRTDTQTRSEFGARFDHAMPLQDALLTLRGRAAWAHDYDNANVANAAFMALPGAAFIVNGARPDADALLLSAGAELAFRNGFSLAGSFEGEFSGNTESYAGKGAIRYRW